MPNAREKLNAAAVNGAMVLAIVIGLTTESFLLGGLVFAALLGMATHSGDIRLKPISRK